MRRLEAQARRPERNRLCRSCWPASLVIAASSFFPGGDWVAICRCLCSFWDSRHACSYLPSFHLQASLPIDVIDGPGLRVAKHCKQKPHMLTKRRPRLLVPPCPPLSPRAVAFAAFSSSLSEPTVSTSAYSFSFLASAMFNGGRE